jgi:dihydrofolate synthase/folylpolyglutamate synthase
MEVVHDAPLVLLDGAHNPHAAGALKEALRELCGDRPIHLLVGMSGDKDAEAVGRELRGVAVSVTCTRSAHPRALDPTALANRLFSFCQDVHVMEDPLDAYTFLLNTVSPREAIVVTGSLFLVGQLRAALRKAHVRLDGWKGAHDADGHGGLA